MLPAVDDELVTLVTRQIKTEMEYLRSLGTAAASTLLQKSGVAYPFILGERVRSFDGKSIWTLHDAVKRDDSSPVSVFSFDGTALPAKPLLPLAKNALRYLKTVRHPDVLKFIDCFETEVQVFIVTERVRPLWDEIKAASGPPSTQEEWLVWGLNRICSAVSFINESLLAIHGNLQMSSVFLASTGEWRLGGFELVSKPMEEAAVLYTSAHFIPEADKTAPPEVKKGGWPSLKDGPIAAPDAYGLGILVFRLFNPDAPLPATIFPPHPQPQPTDKGKLPPPIFTHYKRLVNPSPRARLRTKEFLDIGMQEGGFFSSNKLLQTCVALDGFALFPEEEQVSFLRSLQDRVSTLPSGFASQKVVPSLVTSLSHGGSSTPLILPILFQLGKSLPDDNYVSAVVLPVVSLFEKPNRAIRMALLDGLPFYADKVDARIVSDKIWPNLQTGFSDTVPLVRETTVRAIAHIYPKLSGRILNNDLLRHLAKMQLDPEPSIRTNTCILLAKIAPELGYNTKRKALVPAFARAIKDGFIHARLAGLSGFCATVDCFEPDEVACKVLPVIVTALVDKERSAREQAFKAVDIFIKRLEAHAKTIPDTETDVELKSEEHALSQNSIMNSATGAAGVLAGWAIASLSNKIESGDIQGGENPSILSESNGSPASITPYQPPVSKGLQLSMPTDSNADIWLYENEPSHSQGEWETGFISTSSDKDDWGSFETAAAPVAMAFEKAPQMPSNSLPKNRPESESTRDNRPAQILPDPVGQPAKPLLSKEDKATELARRKEERRQRIAQLKEQKRAKEGSE